MKARTTERWGKEGKETARDRERAGEIDSDAWVCRAIQLCEYVTGLLPSVCHVRMKSERAMWHKEMRESLTLFLSNSIRLGRITFSQ